jgi:hypothetical protein
MEVNPRSPWNIKTFAADGCQPVGTYRFASALPGLKKLGYSEYHVPVKLGNNSPLPVRTNGLSGLSKPVVETRAVDCP